MEKEKGAQSNIFAFGFLHVKKHSELMAWILGLGYLAFFVNPDVPNFSFCLLKWMGIDACWGCGVGRSIAYLFDGNIPQSLKTHPMGIFATLILFYRIFELLTQTNQNRHA